MVKKDSLGKRVSVEQPLEEDRDKKDWEILRKDLAEYRAHLAYCSSVRVAYYEYRFKRRINWYILFLF